MGLLERLLNRKSKLRGTLTAATTPRTSWADRSSGEQERSVTVLTAEANRHFQAGDLPTARALYVRILEADPSNARAYYMLSGIAAQDGDASSAIGLAQRAIALQPAVP